MIRDLDWWRSSGMVAQDRGTYLHVSCPSCGSRDNLVVGPGIHPDGHALLDCKSGCAFEDVAAALDEGAPAIKTPPVAKAGRALASREPFAIRDSAGTLVGVHERRDYSD